MKNKPGLPEIRTFQNNLPSINKSFDKSPVQNSEFRNFLIGEEVIRSSNFDGSISGNKKKIRLTSLYVSQEFIED